MVNLLWRLVFSVAILLGTIGLAQEFVFVSNRMMAEPSVGPSGQPLYQNELFLYRDGSQLRLTFTPEEDEWDPQPSPSGRYLAYVVNHPLTDWSAVAVTLDAIWYLRIIDLESLLVLEEWQLSDAAGLWRPAGGFDIVWSEQEDWLLVQLPDQDGSGSIGRIEPGDPEVRVISRGFGISLQQDYQLVGTTIDGFATVYDMSSGQHHPIRAGEGIGWLGINFIIGGQDQLILYDYMTGSERVLSDFSPAYYPYFASNREGTRHAWFRYEPDFDGTHVTIIDADLEGVTAWDHQAYLSSMEFMDEHTLVATVLVGSFFHIEAVATDTYQEYQLVSTVGFDNTTPVMLPRSASGP